MSEKSNDCLRRSAGFKRTFEALRQGSGGHVCHFARFIFSSLNRGIRGLFYSLRFLNNIIYRDSPLLENQKSKNKNLELRNMTP